MGDDAMTRLEIYRRALTEAVRDGNTDLVKILTRECFALIQQSTQDAKPREGDGTRCVGFDVVRGALSNHTVGEATPQD